MIKLSIQPESVFFARYETIVDGLYSNFFCHLITPLVDIANIPRSHKTIISIHPKIKLENQVKELKYFQVFQEKHKFIPNLSIFDLLFNQGPTAKLLLLQ